MIGKSLQLYTGPGRSASSESSCKSRGRKLDLGLVPYFYGD